MHKNRLLFWAGILMLGIGIGNAVLVFHSDPTVRELMLSPYICTIASLVMIWLHGKNKDTQLMEAYRQPLKMTTSIKIPEGQGARAGIWYVHVLLDPVTQKVSAPTDPADRVVTRPSVSNYLEMKDRDALRVPFWFKDGNLIIYKELYTFGD